MENLKNYVKAYQGKYFAGNNHGKDQNTTYLYIKKIVGIDGPHCKVYADAIFYDDEINIKTIFVKDATWCFGEDIINKWGYKRISKSEFMLQVNKLGNIITQWDDVKW